MFIKSLNLPFHPLDGEVAIVTGSGRGIGRELARALAFLGASVVIAEIDVPTGIELEELIRQEGGTALFIETDVASASAMKHLVDETCSKFGKIDIFVNNAIVVTFGSFLELDAEAWNRTLSVNVLGAVFGIQYVLPSMLERSHGIIVSMISSEGMPYAAPYFASKCALGSLTQSVAVEIGDDTGVSVFNFGPGMVDTPGLDEAAEFMAPKLGMTPREFKHQALNPGYDGPVPAEHAAVGLAIAIMHGEEYHGEVADTFSCLTRYQTQIEDSNTIYLDSSNSSTLVHDFEDLLKIVQAFQDDFSKVNRLMRSFATKEFKKQVGYSAETIIERIKSSLPSMKSSKQSLAREEWYTISTNLKAYIENSMKILPKYVKNPEDLSVAVDSLTYRLEVVTRFLESIRSLEAIIVS